MTPGCGREGQHCLKLGGCGAGGVPVAAPPPQHHCPLPRSGDSPSRPLTIPLCLQLYELDADPKRKEFLDDLFSFMQKRGEHLPGAASPPNSVTVPRSTPGASGGLGHYNPCVLKEETEARGGAPRLQTCSRKGRRRGPEASQGHHWGPASVNTGLQACPPEGIREGDTVAS